MNTNDAHEVPSPVAVQNRNFIYDNIFVVNIVCVYLAGASNTVIMSDYISFLGAITKSHRLSRFKQ